MNPSYGDSTNSAHGRARVPGPDGGYNGQADSAYDPYDGYRDPDRRPAHAHSARASAGRGTVGRASVRSGSGYSDDYQPSHGGDPYSHGGDPYSRGGDPYSRGGDPYENSGELTGSGYRTGATGRATVGGTTGRATVGGTAGRASVGGASGRASVGSPEDFTGPLDPERRRLDGPGGPPGPGGPAGPGTGDGASRARRVRKRKARRRNLILSAVALIVMLSGLTVVGGTYYFDKVPLPADYKLPESTTVYYSDGKTPIAKFGTQNRTIVALSQVSPWVPKAVVATEDNTFYTNSGISIRGIVRAAWNNIKGGNTQGGSTITQQYARQVLDATATDRTVSLKVKEAVVAMKLDQKYSKDKIMEMYLNVVYFGRGAYGIEAAAQAYFHKPALNLTAEESMVLAALIKDPGSGAYDPAIHPDTAKDRFTNYIKPNMVKLKYITQQQADAMQYPTDVVKPDAATASAAEFGKDTPTGLVVHHVMDELSHLTKADGSPMFPDLKDGGYKIITTIDKDMEADALAAASRTGKDSPMVGQPANLQAALVSVQPKTGRVMAYYGGDKGAGFDYAGIYRDPILSDGNWSGGSHPPGSTFKIYTLAAALQAGISIDSYWYGPKSREFPKEDRVKGKLGPIGNSGASCPQGCTLWYALQQSMNTVYYAVGEKVGPAKVLDVAHAMGINYMWANDPTKPTGDRVELTGAHPGEDDVPSKFSNELAIGQFPITVQDQATGVAAIAGGGIAVKAHFVMKVLRGAQVVYQEQLKQTSLTQVGITPEMIQDEQWAMKQVLAPDANNGDRGIALSGGRDAGGKTGTWQYGNSNAENAHAWFVGFTPNQLATAVWVGNADKEQPIRTKDKRKIFGATLPGPIWKKFMDAALKKFPKAQIGDKAGVGDVTLGEAPSPPPPPPSTPPNQNPGGPGGPGPGGPGNCAIPFFCPSPQPSGSSGNGGNGGGGGGGGGGPSPRRSR